jgi:hypothetical protein
MFYNGFGLYEYGVAATFFDAVSIGIDTERLGLPPFIEITAALTRGLAITAPSQEAVEDAFGSFKGDDILTALTEFNVQALVKGRLEGALVLSTLSDVGIIFPDFSVSLGEMNALISIGKDPLEFEVEDGGTQLAYPGLSVFAGTAAAAEFIKSLVEFIVTVCGALPDLVPSWIPIDFDAEDIAGALDFSDVGTSDAFGAGFSANTARSGFLFTMPLLIEELGTIKINCYTDYESFNFETEVESDVGGKILEFFSATAEDIGDGTVWIVRKTGEFFEENGRKTGDFFEDGGKFVAAASEEAIDGLKNAFSQENLSKTASDIKDGFIDFSESVLDEAEILAVNALNALILDPLDDVGPAVEDTVDDIAKWGSDLAGDAEDGFNDAFDAASDAAEVVEDAFECAGNAILNGGSCPAFHTIEEELIRFGNDVVKVLEDIEKEVAEFFGGLASDLFYSSSYQYRTIDPEELDPMYKCKSRRPDQREALQE